MILKRVCQYVIIYHYDSVIIMIVKYWFYVSNFIGFSFGKDSIICLLPINTVH